MLDSPRFSTTRSTRSADQAQWTSPCLLSIHPVQAPPHHLGQSTPGAPRGSEHLKRGPHRAAETRRASAEWPTAMLVAARSAFWVPWSMLKGHLDNSRYNNIYIYLICDLYDNFHALRQARRVGEKNWNKAKAKNSFKNNHTPGVLLFLGSRKCLCQASTFTCCWEVLTRCHQEVKTCSVASVPWPFSTLQNLQAVYSWGMWPVCPGVLLGGQQLPARQPTNK